MSIKTKIYQPAKAAVARGFTLLEVLVVLVMLAILAAIAIPYYGDYRDKAKATEVLHAMAPLKLIQAEAIQRGENAAPVTAAYQAAETSFGASVEGATISPAASDFGDAIEASLTGGNLNTATIVLSPTIEGDHVRWVCTTSGIPAKAIPDTCT